MALACDGEQYATPAVHRSARSTSELTGTALGNVQLPLLVNALKFLSPRFASGAGGAAKYSLRLLVKIFVLQLE